MERRIFVGDVQGCRAELELLLEELAFDPDRDGLFPVGDLVNRGPDSLGTLRLLNDLGARPVLGNHDLHLLRVSQELRELAPTDTLSELLGAPDCDDLLTWLANQPFLRRFPDLYLVHAGLHPEWRAPEDELAGLDPFVPDERTDFATRVRRCDARGGREGASEAELEPWFHFYDPSRHGGRSVVFGHWAARGLVSEPHLRGLDTGCVWGGRLTAWIAEEDRLVSVPATRAHARITS